MFYKSISKMIRAATLGLAMAAAQGWASPIVDQSNQTVLQVGYCTGACEWQQTITAGLTGKLTGVTLFGSGTGEVRIGLGNGFYSGPWAADVQNAGIGGTIDLSSYNIYLTAGQTFMLDTVNISGGLYGTYGNATGQLYLQHPQIGVYAYPSAYALGYVTYVDPDARQVPEPASIALFGLGLVGFAAARRRKQ